MHKNVSGICGVRPRVGYHFRMADKVADCPRCGEWWPLVAEFAVSRTFYL